MTQHRKVDTGKWIQECLELYEDFVRRAAGKSTNPDPKPLEEALLLAGTMKQVGPGELKIIEESKNFPYPKWWPKLSEQFGKPIELPRRLDSQAKKKEAVSKLHEELNHIEVVSIILRFIFPEKFGIISPPVVGLLNLIPDPDKDNVRQYLRYLADLEKLRQHYEFARIADVDMALWVAAHLEPEEHGDLLERMHQDDTFQEIRLRNLLEGLGEHWSRTVRERLILAKVLLRHDPAAGAVIVARCYEKIIREVGKPLGIDFNMVKSDSTTTRDPLKSLAEHPEVRRRGVFFDDLGKLRQSRNDAVHGKKNPAPGESGEISETKAEKFLKGVEWLNERLGDMLA